MSTSQELVSGTLSGELLVQDRGHLEACAVCRTLEIERARDGDPAASGTARTLPASAEAGLTAGGLRERFEIIRPLGRGGMGVVYEALDRQRGARVALKTLHHVSAAGLLRFKTEFRALQDVHHPNLVTFGELIEDRGQWWLTMELVEGSSFLDHVRPGGQLDERRLRAALTQLASALSALHGHGLVHRDVKPQNVLVGAAGRVVLVDFGLVASVAQSDSSVVGTPAYMAPEQGLARDVGPAADWYGVGALLYEALTGTVPFGGAPLQVLHAKLHESPRRPGDLARVPAELEELCMQLLAVEPAARLPSAAALARLDPDAVTAPPPAGLGAPLPAFVGRRRELARLEDSFAETRAGAEAIVLVEGESGIGKSALVEQFLHGLYRRAPAALVLAGRCYERETVPYKAVDGVVDRLARHLRKLPEAEAAAVLPRRAGLLVQAFPVLGTIPALSRLPADEVLDPVELRTRAFTALRELLGRLAERRPLVVWIDDLQWADADSLELLAWVMARPEAPPLLLVLTSRPPREAAGGSSAEAAMARVRALRGLRAVDLLPLPRDEAVALAERLLAETPGAPPASAASLANAAALADEAAGHPLFIDALVRHTAGRSTAPSVLRLSDALWARIAELEPTARQLLALMAVAGWPLSPEILMASAVVSAGELDPALARLRHAHLVRAADGTCEGAVEPYHDRIREAVLDHLDLEPRKACHRALARALVAVATPGGAAWVPEIVGAHLHAAGELEPAARYMVQAADRAAAALAFDHAARLYGQALAIDEESGRSPGPLGDTRDVLARLARAQVNAGRGAEAAAVYFELARRAEAAGEEDLELRLRGAEQLLRTGHRGEGRRALAGVLDELDLQPPATRAGALCRLLWRRAWVRIHGLETLDRDRRAGQEETTARDRLRLEACRVAWMTAELPSEYLTRYQVLASRMADPRSIGLALYAEVNIAVVRGDAGARRTVQRLEALAAVAARSGDPYVLGQEKSTRSLIDIELGRWAHGRAHSAQAMQLLRERCLGASYETAMAAGHHFMCLFYIGDLRDYVSELVPLLREAEERRDHFTQVTLQGFAGVASLIQDQPEVARQMVERGAALWPVVEADIRLMTAEAMHAMIELYEGNGAAAYRLLDQGWCRRMASPLARLRYIRAVMLVCHGVAALAAYRSGEPAHRLVRAAVRDARGLGAMRMPWTCALARVLDAGIALATGDRARGREHLSRAHAELTAAGMGLHATLARRRLGELDGGAEGARAVAEADDWLAAQGVRAPERLARVFMPEVA